MLVVDVDVRESRGAGLAFAGGEGGEGLALDVVGEGGVTYGVA